MAEPIVLRRSTRSRTAVAYNEDSIAAAPAIKLEQVAEVNIKHEPDDDMALMQISTKPASKPRKVTKKVKHEHSDGDSEHEPVPKKSRAKKKKEVPTYPYRLVVLPGMIRPPGERQPPMIFEVVKRPTPKTNISIFHFNIERARSKWKPLEPGEKETRLAQYVEQPRDTYYASAERAATERMFVLKRERSVEENCHAHHTDCPVEYVCMAGSKGNIYQVTISHWVMCSCPDYILHKRACKHIIYVLHHVLKVDGPLKHQNAFLTSELKEIFAKAPLPEATKQETDGKRKPLDDDCPICCMPFEEDDQTVWCKNSCGNSLHQDCFRQWAAVRPGQVTCPFCRAQWEAKQAVQITDVVMPTARDQHGYLNIADQLDYAH